MITTIKNYKLSLIAENISPIRFIESDLSDIIDFVEELLYSPNKIDITEKIAGQHLTVNIKNSMITVNTKDSILHNTGDRDAKSTRYGAEITRPLIDYGKTNKLTDNTFAFEIVSPSKNHDYIKYKNTDTIFIEYTGNLDDNLANEIRKRLRGPVKLLTKKDIKLSINKNMAYDSFKTEWETYLGKKIKSLNPNNKSRYYRSLIVDLKFKIGKLLEDILVSTIDNVSPVEGVVASTKTPIKLQNNTFLDVQRIQMSMFSVFKINKDEIKYVLDNPNDTFIDLKNKYSLSLNSIYKGDLKYSLYDMVYNYLSKNSKLKGIDTNTYRIWMDEQTSNDLLNRLNRNTVKDIYNEIYKIAMK